MPAEIANLADGMWQRALALAGQAANNDDNAARERLSQLQMEVEIRQRSFELREREIDTQARERERAVTDARDHLLSLSKALSREQANNDALRARVADLNGQIEQSRSQIASLIAGANVRNRTRPKEAKAGSVSANRQGEQRASAMARRAKPPTSRPSLKKRRLPVQQTPKSKRKKGRQRKK